METKKGRALSLKHFGVKSPPEDPLLLMDIGSGRALSQNGQLPTMEERDLAARLLIDWNRRHDELWERNPEAAAKITREIGRRIEMEQSRGNNRAYSGNDGFDFERSAAGDPCCKRTVSDCASGQRP